MKIHKQETRAVSDLIEYAQNSRTHSDKQVSKICASITEFGFTNPVLVDENNTIIAGHGRILAAKKLGMEEVTAVVLVGLTEAQKKAYVIADNKLALDAGWDEKTLVLELEAIKELDLDLTLTGFDTDELSELMNMEITSCEPGLTDEDSAPELPETPTTVLGDIWTLGKHRLMCGDSTSIDAVDKLMDGNSIDMLFTDPPYNVGFNGRSGKHDVIKNDDLSDDDFSTFIDDVLATIQALNIETYYIWCNWDFFGILHGRMEYKSCIVWAKNNFGMGIGYRHQHEFCLFNGKVDSDIKNESDLWEVKKDTKYVHPTQKPVELSKRALKNHRDVKNVLDLFGGSGSTLIGCEESKRSAFVMELDEKYCDVIIKRWQEFTGQSAVHAETGATYSEVKGA